MYISIVHNIVCLNSVHLLPNLIHLLGGIDCVIAVNILPKLITYWIHSIEICFSHNNIGCIYTISMFASACSAAVHPLLE